MGDRMSRSKFTHADAIAQAASFIEARRQRHGNLRMEAGESQEATTPTEATHATDEATKTPAQETPKPETDWKAEARKWEQRAKDYKPAADKLAEIEEANKTEAQRVAERLTAAEQRASEAEARAVRRDIALEHGLTKDDAALLDGMTNEDAMRRLAGRLAKAAETVEDPVGFRVDQSGRKTSATPNKDDAARSVFGI